MEGEGEGAGSDGFGDGERAGEVAEALADVGLGVDGGEVAAGGDALFLKFLDDGVAVEALGQRDDVDEPAHPHVGLLLGWAYPVELRQPLGVVLRHPGCRLR